MYRLELSLLTSEVSWLDMLMLVDLDSLAERARSDEILDVLPHAWPNISDPGLLDGLLLPRVHVLVQ